MLLFLTANLHAASHDPHRWPQAWAELCQWFDCPEVFGSGEFATIDLPLSVVNKFDGLIFKFDDGRQNKAGKQNGICIATDAVGIYVLPIFFQNESPPALSQGFFSLTCCLERLA